MTSSKLEKYARPAHKIK